MQGEGQIRIYYGVRPLEGANSPSSPELGRAAHVRTTETNPLFLGLQKPPRMYLQEVPDGATPPAGQAAGGCAEPFPGAGSSQLSVAASRHEAAGAAGDEEAPQCPGKRLHRHLQVSSREIEATAETSRLLPREQLYRQCWGRQASLQDPSPLRSTGYLAV